MTSTRQKMYNTNTRIRKFLVEAGFIYLYFCPHLRFQKDYYFKGQPFDAIGWKKGEKKIYLFQFTTKRKPSKKILATYKKLEKEYYVKLRWVTRFKGNKIVMYGEEDKK